MRGFQALAKIAEKLGVKFVYGMPVKKINVGKWKKMESLETADGRLWIADIFVGNADSPCIYKELLPDVKRIHAPWEFGLKISGYPERPIVEREIVKERTLAAYSASKKK